MTDLALRRQARQAGFEPEAEAELFYRELRAGLIEPKRAELLAYLGEPRVCEALGAEPPQGERVGEWIQGLSRWGRTPCQCLHNRINRPNRLRLRCRLWG